MPLIARLGDSSSHGGEIIQVSSVKTKAEGILIALDGDLHACPITGHGITPISPITVKSYAEGKLILTQGAIAGCGALIISSAQKRLVE
jgi:uncharacterized Zn-binding protein involved in type VI secretion